MQIVGVTFGDPWYNADWVESEGFQYEIWTDTNRELAIYYGAAANADAAFPARITRLLDSNGALLLEYDSVSTSTSPYEILEDCQLLFGPQ